ncbi:hypothetical protein [Candidatus Mycoplasma haematohominis]|uniref:hypothetical protein n=1 Tax=Candidatus Mycoplasma haematohominis TaxID=1494318 RepID=UPI001C0A757E|nr:hypothetical protein [Candidatus Mycoplasma haemohominis]
MLTPPTKLEAAVAVVVGGTTGGYFWLQDPGNPPFTVEQRSISYGNSTFGQENAKYLVDPNDSRNKEWWDEKFTKLSIQQTGSDAANKLHEDFRSEAITSGFGDDKSLNKVCDTAFKTQKNTWSTKTHYEDNVWTYCSLLGVDIKANR